MPEYSDKLEDDNDGGTEEELPLASLHPLHEASVLHVTKRSIRVASVFIEYAAYLCGGLSLLRFEEVKPDLDGEDTEVADREDVVTGHRKFLHVVSGEIAGRGLSCLQDLIDPPLDLRLVVLAGQLRPTLKLTIYCI